MPAPLNNYKEVAKEHGIKAGEYMKLKQGDNRVRLVTEFEAYDVKDKWSKDADAKRTRFLAWVLNRDSGEFALLEVGYSIFGQLGALSLSNDWGFTGLPPYDVVIHSEGSGKDTEYTVMPSRNDAPLTQEEQEAVKELKPLQYIIERKLAKERQEEMSAPL